MTMSTHSAAVVVHIDENLSDREIHEVERRISTGDGVQAACVHQRTRHLMVVDYDAERIKSLQLLGELRSQGLHAALVGGI
jgi:hypothetical protein